MTINTQKQKLPLSEEFSVFKLTARKLQAKKLFDYFIILVTTPTYAKATAGS
jgi:hypothetical protein